MPDDYKLGPAEHMQIFARRILPAFLTDTVAQASPVAIITGGQPGAGKSKLVARAYRELAQRGGAVVIDADMLRAYHPQYAQLVHSGDLSAANHTHADAAQWAVRLRASAIAARRNVIIDQTSRDPEAFAAICEELRAGGVGTIEFRVMAVTAAVSRLRIFARYEEQYEHGGGRFSTRSKHDDAYAGVVRTVTRVEAEGLVDAIQFYDANHDEIHRDTRGPTGWLSPASPAAILSLERSRPITSSERTTYIASLFDVIDRAMHRRAGAPYINEVRELTRELGDDLPLAQPGETYEGRIVRAGGAEIVQLIKGRGLVEHKRALLRDSETLRTGEWSTIEYNSAGQGRVVGEGAKKHGRGREGK